MKKLLFSLCLLWSGVANAQFTPGQLLTAAELNTQFSLYAPLTGATFTGGISATGITGTPISGSTGAFTTLSASGTVSGVGFTNLLAPYALLTGAAFSGGISATGITGTPISGSTGSFTTLSSSTPVGVASGGTGLGSLTAFNVLIGNGTGNIAFAAPGAAGIPLTSRGAGTNPGFQGITVAGGGTGLTTIPAHGVVIGEGTGNVATATGTTGQMLVGSTGADPVFGNTVSTLTATGAITPSTTAGIVGTTAADNANAGSVGEYQTASTSGTSLTSGTAANATSISLPAGDWDVTGIADFVAAAGTNTAYAAVGISTSSAVFQNAATGIVNQTLVNYGTVTNTGIATILAPPVTRISVSTTTTVYAVVQSQFSGSTMTVGGFIRARRVR